MTLSDITQVFAQAVYVVPLLIGVVLLSIALATGKAAK